LPGLVKNVREEYADKFVANLAQYKIGERTKFEPFLARRGPGALLHGLVHMLR